MQTTKIGDFPRLFHRCWNGNEVQVNSNEAPEEWYERYMAAGKKLP